MTAMGFTRRLVVGENDDPLQIPTQQQVNGSNSGRQLACATEYGQIGESSLPVRRQVGIVTLAQVSSTESQTLGVS